MTAKANSIDVENEGPTHEACTHGRATAGLIALSISCVPTVSSAASTSSTGTSGATIKSVLNPDYPLTLDPLRADASAIADQTGASEKEVLTQLNLESLFNGLVEKTSAAFPDSYAYASFSPREGETVIGFAGEVPEAARLLIESAGLQVSLRDDFPVSEKTRTSMANQALESFMKVAGADNALARVDPKTLTITIDYTNEGVTIDSGTSDSVRRGAISGLAVATPIPDVRLVATSADTPSVTAEVMSGGAALGLGPDGSRDCTAGFTVRNTRGGVGLMTAAHCQDGLNYERRFALNFAGEAKNVNTDAQWHTASDSVWNRFIWTSVGGYQTRLATSTNGSSLGTQVCNYGDANGGYCSQLGTVLEQGLPVVDRGTTYYGLTCMSKYATTGGDSGGPYYVGEQARGIHFGRMSFDKADHSCFTPISRIQGTTDLRVLTQ